MSCVLAPSWHRITNNTSSLSFTCRLLLPNVCQVARVKPCNLSTPIQATIKLTKHWMAHMENHLELAHQDPSTTVYCILTMIILVKLPMSSNGTFAKQREASVTVWMRRGMRRRWSLGWSEEDVFCLHFSNR